jgi:hypothetical protein
MPSDTVPHVKLRGRRGPIAVVDNFRGNRKSSFFQRPAIAPTDVESVWMNPVHHVSAALAKERWERPRRLLSIQPRIVVAVKV